MKLNRLSHKVTLNFWHLEWCTKYRYKMMRKLSNRNMVTASIRKAAKEHKIKIIELEVMPEHVHMSCSLPNGMTDSKENYISDLATSNFLQLPGKMASKY